MGTKPLQTKVLTDRLLRSWIRCRRKAWLDKYGDSKKRIWTAHRTLFLDYQQRTFVSLIPSKPGRGLKACKEGISGVVGIRLKGRTHFGHPIEAHPPLLQKISGQSCWGNFSYRPVLARQGRRVTKEHRFALALTGMLLEPIQQTKVKTGICISENAGKLTVEEIKLNDGLNNQLIDAIKKINNELNQDVVPPIISDRRKCSLCSWRGICNSEASAAGHLSEVSGIGARRDQILQEIGVQKLNELADLDPIKFSKELEQFGEQHVGVAKQLIAQAIVQRDGTCEKLEEGNALPEIISAPGVLIYDIESDPDAKDNFLHGFLRIKHKDDGEWDLRNAKYHPLLMILEQGEAKSWQRLKHKLNNYPKWPILHYGETESLAIYRMAKSQGATQVELKELQKRLIDVHARLRKYWRLPLNNYSLKTIANWMNFKWTEIGADGPRALLWWRQWKNTKYKSKKGVNKLNKIFQYNKDDCLATWAVAKWIINQK